MSSLSTVRTLFVEQIEAAAGITHATGNRQEALTFALDLAASRTPGLCLLDGMPLQKALAAPGMEAEDLAFLQAGAHERGVTLITEDLRDHLGGISVSVFTTPLGIAETGTCIQADAREDVRLAGMLAEAQVIILSESHIVPGPTEAAPLIDKFMAEGPVYLSCISGPSRTADIERVRALGVHGPLELHVVVVGE